MLRNRLQKSGADTGRVSLLLKLSAYYSNIAKPSSRVKDSTMVYARGAEKLSIALAYPKGLGNSQMAIAKAYLLKKDSSGCNKNVRNAINLFLKHQLYRDAAEAYLKLEEYYQFFGGHDLKVRIAYYEKVLPLFQRAGAKEREQPTLKILGDFYLVKGDNIKAMQYLQQGLKLIQYVQLIDKEALYDLLGSAYSMAGNLDKALEYGLLAVKMTEQGKDTTSLACAVYNRVGVTYDTMNEFQHARTFYKKSLTIALKNRDTPAVISGYLNIAGTLIKLGQFKDCIILLKKVTKSYPLPDISYQARLDCSFVKCYIGLKDFEAAKVYCDRLESTGFMRDQYSNAEEVIQNLLIEYYVTTAQDKPAREHLAFLKKMAIRQRKPLALANAYLFEARLDSTEHHYASAYKNYRISGNIRDSIYNETKSLQIAQLQIQFDTEKKDQELKEKEERIKLLNSQAHLQQINLRQEKTTQKLIIAAAILLSVLLGLSYNGYRLKQRVNRQLHAQRIQIERKNESLTKMVQQKENLLTEKEWLMKEIHHRVKNNLQIVISLLNTQANFLDNDIAYNAIRESQHRMQSISLIHQKLYQSENLALVDINSYISDLVDYLRDSFDTGSRIAFEMDIVDIELDVTRAVPLGLILNEAITNSIKYAFPDNRNGKISISLKSGAEDSFALKIQDNGTGLPLMTDITKSKSLGMSLMRGLSKQLGGSLKIESGDGITIIVNFIDESLLKAV